MYMRSLPSTSGGVTERIALLSEGFADLEAAFAAADAELGEATPSDVPEGMPPAGAEAEADVEQAVEEQVEQPEVAETTDDTEVDEDLQSLVDELVEDGDEGGEDSKESKADPVAEFLASDDLWDTEVDVDFGDGNETVKLRELVDRGYRQADYTKKTQALAEERAKVEDAAEFYRVFEEDPVEFARALAVKANLIEQGAQPVKEIETAKFTSPEDYEAEIERRVEERFTSDPRFSEMQKADAQSRVNLKFAEMESARGITLSPELRQSLIDEAVRTNTTDMDQVLDARLYRRQQQRARSDETKRKAPSRPRKSGGPTAPDTAPKIDSIDDAFEQALLAVGA